MPAAHGATEPARGVRDLAQRLKGTSAINP
jgi:hypothetical protein